jgi:hypothetical protein
LGLISVTISRLREGEETWRRWHWGTRAGQN